MSEPTTTTKWERLSVTTGDVDTDPKVEAVCSCGFHEIGSSVSIPTECFKANHDLRLGVRRTT